MTLEEFIKALAGPAFGAFSGFIATTFWTYRNEKKQKLAVRRMLKLEIELNLIMIRTLGDRFKGRNVHSQFFEHSQFQEYRKAFETLMPAIPSALNEDEITNLFKFYEACSRVRECLANIPDFMDEATRTTAENELQVIIDAGSPLAIQPKSFWALSRFLKRSKRQA